MRVCLRPFEDSIFVHDLFFGWMHVPGQLIFKHELCQELTINLRSKLVEAFFFDKAILAEEWRKFEAKPRNHSDDGKFEREARWVGGYEFEGVRHLRCEGTSVRTLRVRAAACLYIWRETR
jgi:hypothetical protein